MINLGVKNVIYGPFSVKKMVPARNFDGQQFFVSYDAFPSFSMFESCFSPLLNRPPTLSNRVQKINISLVDDSIISKKLVDTP